MNGPLFLLCCIEILGALLCGAQSVASAADSTSSQNPAQTGKEINSHSNADAISSTSKAWYPTNPTGVASGIPATQPKAVSQDSNSHSISLSPSPQPIITTTTNTPFAMFYKKECLPVYMTAGGLIIACTILLISTMLLMCKVCQLSSRIKMLSDNADLISTSEYWMGTAKRSKSAPETDAKETDAKETTVLMADIGQTQGGVGNGAAKEEAAKANEDGQTGEEDKKEVGDTAKSGDASTTPVVGNASSSKPQEEATDSQTVKAGAASSSKGTEEPKEEV